MAEVPLGTNSVEYSINYSGDNPELQFKIVGDLTGPNSSVVDDAVRVGAEAAAAYLAEQYPAKGLPNRQRRYHGWRLDASWPQAAE